MASNGNSVLWEADDASTARMPDNEEHRAVDPVLSEEDFSRRRIREGPSRLPVISPAFRLSF